jgi:hypothetical protein
VLLAVLVVLLQGAFDHGAPSDPDAVAEMGAPVPAPAGSFRPNLEKTPLTYESDYWRQIGERAAENLVLLGPERTPGVLITPGIALTSLRAADEVARSERQQQAERRQLEKVPGDQKPPLTGVAAADPRFAAAPRLMAVDVENRVALFAIAEVAPSSFHPADAATLHPGAFVAGVSLGPSGDLRITPGHLASTTPDEAGNAFTTTIGWPGGTRVAAIIDLDGELLGIAIEMPEGMRMLTTRRALELAARLHDEQACQAIETAELDETAKGLLGLTGGVVVERVLRAAFAAAPAAQAGDVLLEWNGEAVTSTKAFADQYRNVESGRTVPVRLLRGRRRLTVTVRMPLPDCRPSAEPLVEFGAFGITAEWRAALAPEAPRGWEVVTVRQGSPAAEANLEPGDLIFSADGVALTRASVRAPFDRFEARPRPMLVAIRRGDRVKLVAVSPAHD